MKNYILNKKSINISEILASDNSLSAFSFRVVPLKNDNFLPLKNLLIENKKGFEPGRKKYINFTENYFVRISELDDVNFTFNISLETKRIIPPKENRVQMIKGDICYQTASNVGNVCIYNDKKAYFNSHLRKINFKKDKFYIFALLKSQFCKNQVEVGGSIKGV
ncbi:hypothetical protein KAI32_03790, partial [Candidatus Pacearchaeota archaeon]|nr:hypothetical protein [Candidatus Pacearchaeota archaeon]